jgi:putative transposase
MPRYRRHHVPGHPVFLTIVTHGRRPWLAEDQATETLLASMRWAKTRYPFRHLAHVILPDHLHWLLRPAEDTCFSDLVAAVKRDVTWRRKAAGSEGPLWQSRFYDHLIRDPQDLARHLDYIHYNPVKHGHASRAGDYPHSSFAEYVKRGVYIPDWGQDEPDGIRDLAPE